MIRNRKFPVNSVIGVLFVKDNQNIYIAVFKLCGVRDHVKQLSYLILLSQVLCRSFTWISDFTSCPQSSEVSTITVSIFLMRKSERLNDFLKVAKLIIGKNSVLLLIAAMYKLSVEAELGLMGSTIEARPILISLSV